MDSIVGVTQTEFVKTPDTFERAAESGLTCVRVPVGEQELARALCEHRARHVVLGVAEYRGDALYDALATGGVAARFGVGYDGIDLSKATERGIFVTNTPGVLDASVAEHTMGLILAAARQVPRLDQSVRAGVWAPEVGTEVHGRRLAIIGCGAVGCAVARIASRGLSMNVIGCMRREVDPEPYEREYGFSRVVSDFEQAVSDADFVSLHIPSVPETRNYLDYTKLKCLPTKAWLINTARGAVVDEGALYRALETGLIAGAALDVFDVEPYVPAEPDKDLRTLPNVILTPHVGSATGAACSRMAERALENIRLAEAGRFGDMDLVNPEVLRTHEE